jgi:hypothetical protein
MSHQTNIPEESGETEPSKEDEDQKHNSGQQISDLKAKVESLDQTWEQVSNLNLKLITGARNLISELRVVREWMEESGVWREAPERVRGILHLDAPET